MRSLASMAESCAGCFLYDVYTAWTYNKLVEAQRLAIIFVSRAQLIYNKTRLC
jgi:hypothetical protein